MAIFFSLLQKLQNNNFQTNEYQEDIEKVFKLYHKQHRAHLCTKRNGKTFLNTELGTRLSQRMFLPLKSCRLCSRLQMFYRLAVLKNSQKNTRNGVLFFVKVHGPATILAIELHIRCFPMIFLKK